MKAILFGKESDFNKVIDFIFLKLNLDFVDRIEYVERVYLNGFLKNSIRVFSKNNNEIIILISGNKLEFKLIKEAIDLLKRKYKFNEQEKILNKGYYIEKIYILKQEQEPEFI